MALACGIIGLPNVGKSTFFSALCQREVLQGNFPFCTIEPNIGVVSIPDERLGQLNQHAKAQAVIPTTITFIDIAGLVKGASEGEGLGNQFLANIRSVDALVHVVRCFESDAIIHVAGSVDPLFDLEVINQELRLADLALLKRRAGRLEKTAKSGKKQALEEHALLKKFITHLEQGIDARAIEIKDQEKPWVHSWQLLTIKPVIYVANVDEATLQGAQNQHLEALQRFFANGNTQVMPICIALEAQLAQLPPAERPVYLDMYGLQNTTLNPLIRAAYRLLNLITYFTVGPKEVRAWTIPQGTLAPAAAGVIHSDFEKGFIKAEVIQFSDYLHHRSTEACREAGKVAFEGKNYLVQDGDILYFKCKT